MSTKMELGTDPFRKGRMVEGVKVEGRLSATVEGCPDPIPSELGLEALVDIARKLEVLC